MSSRCLTAAPDRAPTSARGLREGHRAGQPSPAIAPVQNAAGTPECQRMQARVAIPAASPRET